MWGHPPVSREVPTRARCQRGYQDIFCQRRHGQVIASASFQTPIKNYYGASAISFYHAIPPFLYVINLWSVRQRENGDQAGHSWLVTIFPFTGFPIWLFSKTKYFLFYFPFSPHSLWDRQFQNQGELGAHPAVLWELCSRHERGAWQKASICHSSLPTQQVFTRNFRNHTNNLRQ